METLLGANPYGNIREDELTDEHVWLKRPRLQSKLRPLGIPFAPVLIGWKGTKRYPRPVLMGFAVLRSDFEQHPQLQSLAAELPAQSEEEKKALQQKRAENRAKRQLRDIRKFAQNILEEYPKMAPETATAIAARACEVGSGRVGRSASLSTAEKVELAVRAHFRHQETCYDDLLLVYGACAESDDAREMARQDVGAEIDAIIDELR